MCFHGQQAMAITSRIASVSSYPLVEPHTVATLRYSRCFSKALYDISSQHNDPRGQLRESSELMGE